MTSALALILRAYARGGIPLALVPNAPMRWIPGVVRYRHVGGRWVAR